MITTDEIYDLYAIWFGGEDFDSEERRNYNIISKYRDYKENEEKFIDFIRFYDNGNISFFSRNKDSSLDKEMLNPLKGAIGVYNVEEEIIILQRYGAVGHGGRYINGKAIIKGDTLHVIEKVLNYDEHSIFIKRKVPDSILDWKADW